MSAVSAESPRGSADLTNSSANSPQGYGGPPANGAAERADFGPNQWLVDELYQRYLADPGSVDQAWWSFFADYHPVPENTASASSSAVPANTVASPAGAAAAAPAAAPPAATPATAPPSAAPPTTAPSTTAPRPGTPPTGSAQPASAAPPQAPPTEPGSASGAPVHAPGAVPADTRAGAIAPGKAITGPGDQPGDARTAAPAADGSAAEQTVRLR